MSDVKSGQAEGGALLCARGVRKRLGGREVLAGIDFDLAEGGRVALMGPSGAGKTTFLNCLGGIDRIDSGSLCFAGRDLAELDQNAIARLRRRSIGTVFQFFHLLPTLTARENILLPLQLNGFDAKTRAERTERILEETGVAGRADAFPGELSGGEMQRVAIARALATEPRLLLADEPTGNLDSRTGAAILDLIEAVTCRHRIALVMVTHSLESTRICDRVLRFNDGRIEEEIVSA